MRPLRWAKIFAPEGGGWKDYSPLKHALSSTRRSLRSLLVIRKLATKFNDPMLKVGLPPRSVTMGPSTYIFLVRLAPDLAMTKNLELECYRCSAQMVTRRTWPAHAADLLGRQWAKCPSCSLYIFDVERFFSDSPSEGVA